jgi:hypothetical protein
MPYLRMRPFRNVKQLVDVVCGFEVLILHARNVLAIKSARSTLTRARSKSQRSREVETKAQYAVDW